MKPLNTTSKGDKFEKQVYELVKKLVENDEFIGSGKRSRVFWKKGYYSQARRKEIIFDIAIETYLSENTNKYSFLTIIECKDYEGTVPVDDVEELDSKLNQIGEHNTKGIIFTKTGFQVSASNLAISKGIGIAIVNKNEISRWISYRKDRNKIQDNNVNDKSTSSSSDVSKKFFAFADNLSFSNLPDLFIHIGVIDKYSFEISKIRIPFIKNEQIEERINQLQIEYLYKDGKLDAEILCESLSKSLNVKFIFDEVLDYEGKEKVLGKIIFNPLKVYISQELKLNLSRWRFTLAHGIGHLLLHNEILSEYIDENVDIEKNSFS